MDPIASPLCTPRNVDMDGSDLASSIASTPSSKGPPPGQPYPSYATPAIPSAAICGIRWCGNSSRVQ